MTQEEARILLKKNIAQAVHDVVILHLAICLAETDPFTFDTSYALEGAVYLKTKHLPSGIELNTFVDCITDRSKPHISGVFEGKIYLLMTVSVNEDLTVNLGELDKDMINDLIGKVIKDNPKIMSFSC